MHCNKRLRPYFIQFFILRPVFGSSVKSEVKAQCFDCHKLFIGQRTWECAGMEARFNNYSTIPLDSLKSFIWDFGDGIQSSDSTPSHEYDTYGRYEICLKVSNRYCSSIFCNSVGMDSSGALLKKGGFIINVVDALSTENLEKKLLNLTVSPNPNTGSFSLKFDHTVQLSDLNIQLFNALGQKTGYEIERFSNTSITVNLKNHIPGTYYLRVVGIENKSAVVVIEVQ